MPIALERASARRKKNHLFVSKQSGWAWCAPSKLWNGDPLTVHGLLSYHFYIIKARKPELKVAMIASLRCQPGVSSSKSPFRRDHPSRDSQSPTHWRIMSHAYVIECGELAAGIVTREKRGFIFHAAADAFFRLNGQFFRTPQEAQRAAERLRRCSPRTRG